MTEKWTELDWFFFAAKSQSSKPMTIPPWSSILNSLNSHCYQESCPLSHVIGPMLSWSLLFSHATKMMYCSAQAVYLHNMINAVHLHFLYTRQKACRCAALTQQTGAVFSLANSQHSSNGKIKTE